MSQLGLVILWISQGFLLLGSAMCLIAALGILRFPDIYTRLHAASKAGPLGAGLVLIALAILSADWAIAARCLLGLVFLLATTPLAAHLLARAALRAGIKPIGTTSIE